MVYVCVCEREGRGGVGGVEFLRFVWFLDNIKGGLEGVKNNQTATK